MNEEYIIYLSYYLPGILLSTLFGMMFGGYATMAVYRLGIGMNWIGKKTRCISCDQVLKLIDYLPIFSWYITKGKCRYCNANIENRLVYLLVELASTIFFIVNFFKFSYSDYYLIMGGAIVTAVTIMAIDHVYNKIPNKTLLVLLIFALLYRLIQDNNLMNLIINLFACLFSGVVIRDIYFKYYQDYETGKDFTRYEDVDRFDGDGFQYIKLLTVTGLFFSSKDIILYLIIITCASTVYIKHSNSSNTELNSKTISVPILTIWGIYIYYYY